jgi:hypothetical protein
MKKITTYIKDGGVTLDLWDPLVLTHESELFVKTAAVFWNYKNVRAGYNNYISVDGKKVTMDEKRWMTEIGVPSSHPFRSTEPDLLLEP